MVYLNFNTYHKKMNIWYLKIKKNIQSDNNDPWNDKLWEKITKRLYEHLKNLKNDKKIKIETFICNYIFYSFTFYY